MDRRLDGVAFHPHFSPWLADSEQLARTLVGHHQILRDFLARLRAVEDGATANHMLLIGPRGIGKTHVLSLAERYVSGRLPIPEGWAGPARSWACVLFTEEEYAGQNSLANFLLTLFSKLREGQPLEPLWRLPEQLPREEDQAVVDCCFERLARLRAERGQRVLIVLDNLQKILQQWPERDHQRLRSFLSADNVLVILGSAPSVFRAILDQKAAFHDFFEIRILRELDPDEVLELLSRRFEEDGQHDEFAARSSDLSRKIPAIQVLTGGNPRLVLFLYQIATQSTFLDIEIALRRLLEELREYFVRRFEDLPPQTAKVLDTMAQMAGPATPTEIAAAARLRPALVNAQLKRLKEGNYVRPVKYQQKKETRYDISESLFRIWRQTATVAGRQRFRILADFLKLYFTTEEVRALYAQHSEYLRPSPEVAREDIIRHVEELFYFQEAGADPESSPAWFQLGAATVNLGRHERALEAVRKAATLSKPSAGLLLAQAEELRLLGRSQESLSAVESGLALEPKNAGLWLEKAWSKTGLGLFPEAFDALERARQHGTSAGRYHHDRGDLLLLSGEFAKALNELDAGLEIEPDNWDMQTDRLIALGCLGQQGPLMEAFPALLTQVHVPAEKASTVSDFMNDVALNCLRRGEAEVARGLFAATLGVTTWHSSEWFPMQAGAFLRRVLDVSAKDFPEFVALLVGKVGNESVLKVLDPFIKAADLLRTKDVNILEKLFPEVRTLVMDVVRRVDPDLHEQLKRLM